jgi:hypothetical protein
VITGIPEGNVDDDPVRNGDDEYKTLANAKISLV